MINYKTSGQVAKELRVSVSTIKRIICRCCLNPDRNRNGWILFSDQDIRIIKKFAEMKNNGLIT